MNSVLVLICDSPLQSFGVRSKWEHRDTAMFPTKSSILGLIGSSMGLSRDDKYLDTLGKDLKVHVRIDKMGNIEEDFQIIGQVYQFNTGKLKKLHGNTNQISHKYYIADGIFTVFVEGEKELINDCYNAIQNPVYPLFVGRKCCPVSINFSNMKPFENIDDIEDFIVRFPVSGIDRVVYNKKENDDIQFEYYLEKKNGNIIVYDELTSRGQKFYNPRSIIKNNYIKKVKELV